MNDDRQESPVNAAGLAPTRAQLSRAQHLPGYIYSSPELYAREIDEYFMRDWLFVGRVEELEKPGDFMTMRLLDQPVVVARHSDGELYANYDMCVHRGAEIAYGSGNRRSFSCPYHGWTYDLSGQLRGAAHMKETEDFEIAKCRLKPLKLATWRGNLFLSFNPSPQPFDDFIRDYEEEFAFLHMEKCRLAQKMRLELNCNWKFFHENVLDNYHVRVLHASSFGKYFTATNENIRLKKNGGVAMYYEAGPPTPGAEPLLGKMPWLEDKDYSFACQGYLAPNFSLFGRIDCVRPMISWPLGPNKCEVIIYHLFPEECFSRPDFQEKLRIYREYGLAVLEEDRVMIESMQKAMSSPAYSPGRMSVLEMPVHHYINAHLDRMFGDAGRQEGAPKAAE